MIRIVNTTAKDKTRFRRPGMKLAAIALVALLLCPPTLGAKVFDEAAVKAVFLFRLALFVTWPEPITSSTNTPFVIGIMGTDPFESRLEAVVQGERIGPLAIEIHRYTSLEEIKAHPCQLLYVGDVGAGGLARVADLAQKYKILTVSDSPRFAHQGGMMAIETVAKRIRITINLAATRQAGFSISAKLLKIANLVSSNTP